MGAGQVDGGGALKHTHGPLTQLRAGVVSDGLMRLLSDITQLFCDSSQQMPLDGVDGHLAGSPKHISSCEALYSVGCWRMFMI